MPDIRTVHSCISRNESYPDSLPLDNGQGPETIRHSFLPACPAGRWIQTFASLPFRSVYRVKRHLFFGRQFATATATAMVTIHDVVERVSGNRVSRHFESRH